MPHPPTPPPSVHPPSQSRIPRWWPRWFTRDLLLLFAGRGLRSLAQAYLIIIVPLYLARLGFDAVQLGILFTAAAVASALLTAGVGFLSDRWGRKTFLVLISLLMAAGGLVFALTGNFVALVVAGALGTIGRGGGAGSGGAWGPFYPAEQALLAEHAGDERRTSIFGVVSFVGVLTGAVGSLLAAIPDLLRQNAGMSLVSGYRVLFALTVVLGVATALLFLPVRETGFPAGATKLNDHGTRQSREGVGSHANGSRPPGEASSEASSEAEGERRVWGFSEPSWRLVWRFMITNATNGVAIGIIGPFIVYWFHLRYGVTSGTLAGLFFVINLVAALPYLLAGRLVRWVGAVNLVVGTRLASVVLLAFLALMPTYAAAAGLYLVRSIAISLSNPVRQSFLMGVIPPRERASAAGVSNLPMQVAMIFSPYVAGLIIQDVALNLPLEIAAAFQGINAALYYAFFRDVHLPEETARRPRAALASPPANASEADDLDDLPAATSATEVGRGRS